LSDQVIERATVGIAMTLDVDDLRSK
jgi:hypothetical protein